MLIIIRAYYYFKCIFLTLLSTVFPFLKYIIVRDKKEQKYNFFIELIEKE